MEVSLEQVILHCRSERYNITLSKGKKQRNANQEFFTPTDYLKQKLSQINPNAFTDPTIPVMDNMMGSCQILSEVLIKRMENGLTYEQAIQTLFGMDIDEENVRVSRERMLVGQQKYQNIINHNFQQGNALKLPSYLKWKEVTFGNNLFEIA